ncbi:hypothetical protein [Actimicrobium antarcticum]|uniref:Secreted protein n=1 Tax=Actimicrobium antarcticum TaxID=1051899 RepID=A0ABP7TKU5_9BURK
MSTFKKYRSLICGVIIVVGVITISMGNDSTSYNDGGIFQAAKAEELNVKLSAETMITVPTAQKSSWSQEWAIQHAAIAERTDDEPDKSF